MKGTENMKSEISEQENEQIVLLGNREIQIAMLETLVDSYEFNHSQPEPVLNSIIRFTPKIILNSLVGGASAAVLRRILITIPAIGPAINILSFLPIPSTIFNFFLGRSILKTISDMFREQADPVVNNNHIPDIAGDEAIYNLLLYLLDPETAKKGSTLSQVLKKLAKIGSAKEKDSQSAELLNLVKNIFDSHPHLHDTKIIDFVSDYNDKDGGMKACALADLTGTVHIVFAGTGAGEWLDNGEGLSGVPRDNIYEKYDPDSKLLHKETVKNDYATGQQVEALNWFNKLCKKHKWDRFAHIVVSGHSKGGNKAQFIAVNSKLVAECYSFDGQGFSPEAISKFNKSFSDYRTRQNKIYSISTDKDIVNVLGKRVVPEKNIFFLRSSDIQGGPCPYHRMEALLDEDGFLNPACPQSKTSQFIQSVSDTVMSMPPKRRKDVPRSIMSIFQNYMGGDTEPVGGEQVSKGEMAKGIPLAIIIILTSLLFTKEGDRAVSETIEDYMKKLGKGIQGKMDENLNTIRSSYYVV